MFTAEDAEIFREIRLGALCALAVNPAITY